VKDGGKVEGMWRGCGGEMEGRWRGDGGEMEGRWRGYGFEFRRWIRIQMMDSNPDDGFELR
jgi:hypothetical protein